MNKNVIIVHAIVVLITLNCSVLADETQKLPQGFEIPNVLKDQHGNPVLKGVGEKTGLPKEVWHKGTGIEFVLIEPGTFTMGSIEYLIETRPIHPVRITKPFYLGKYEVTNEQYLKRMPTSAKRKDASLRILLRSMEHPNAPVEEVSWNYARSFCQDLGCDLPTEAQWEYACRADSVTRFYFGDDESILDDYAWWRKNALLKEKNCAHDVGQKKPNKWGLYDMHGNVQEWCRDWYDLYPEYSPDMDIPTDPEGPPSGKSRVLRSGSYNEPAIGCISGARRRQPPNLEAWTIGFRCAISLP